MDKKKILTSMGIIIPGIIIIGLYASRIIGQTRVAMTCGLVDCYPAPCPREVCRASFDKHIFTPNSSEALSFILYLAILLIYFNKDKIKKFMCFLFSRP